MVVGVDLGTSGIKVAVREATDSKRKPIVIDFGTRTPGYSRFAFPSTVWVKGNRILAGDDAEGASSKGEGITIRSAKMSILRGMRSAGSLAGAFGGDLPAHPIPIASEDEFALAFLLASALRRVHEILDSQRCGPTHAKILYNLDIPVDQVVDDDVSRRFLRVLDAAVHMAPFDLHAKALKGVLSLWWEIVGDWRPDAIAADERTRNLVAEAHCILAGIGDAVPLKRNTPYAVVDIGAGTTDVGIFRLSQWNGEEVINFFSAGTAPVGCNQLDEIIGSSLSLPPRDRNTGISAIRNIKHVLVTGRDATVKVGGRNYVVPASVLPTAIRDVGKKCNAHYIALWRKACEKNRNPSSWSNMTLLIVGGGGLLPEIGRPICDIPVSLRKYIQNQKVESIGDGRPSDVWGNSSVQPTPAENMLLVAARGLTYTSVQLKQLVHPWEITKIAAPGRRGSSSETVIVRPDRPR